jgi:transposase
MMPKAIERIDLDMKEIEALLAEARAALNEESYDKLEKLVHGYLTLSRLIEDKQTTITRLRKLLFGAPTEKTRDVCGSTSPNAAGDDGDEGEEKDETHRGAKKKPPRKGHGRNGAADYRGAATVAVAHESLHPGNTCPLSGCAGTVYRQKEPGVIVRIRGQAPLQATVYQLEKFRCHLCGTVFTAQPPAAIGDAKYDATSAAMIGLLKYGSGLPFNRLERLQAGLGIPLPASTQWDIVHAAAVTLEPVHAALIRQAAQGEVLHNDDTGMTILSCLDARTKTDAFTHPSGERTGVFTSGIVSVHEGRRIALFFTGHQHAGENLADVLRQRAAALDAPIQMCDALSRNLPGAFEILVANCIAHARRRFVDVVPNFPEECQHVLEILADVYENDAIARAENLSPDERLAFHQAKSGPLMVELDAWFTAQFAERKVEPNSGLGEAITYMQNHWEKLTLFLREPGAPLDNNICERALKKVILHRKNALFYKTKNGARVGDMFMSLIHTAELSAADPFHYLTALQENAEAVAKRPENWMPWNYRETLHPEPASLAT